MSNSRRSSPKPFLRLPEPLLIVPKRREGQGNVELPPAAVTSAVLVAGRLRLRSGTAAYNATTRRRDPARDFNLHPSNVFPEGITHWSGYLFVVDNLGEVYAYEADTGRHEPAFDFTLAFENGDARGIADAALGETDYFFVVDWTAGNEKVYVYDAFSGNWVRSNDFPLAAENEFPEGISFADPGGGGVLLVVDSADEKAYAYGLQRRPSADVNFSASNADPRGIVQFNGVVYVVDGEDSYVYAYAPYGTAASQNDSAEPLLSASGSEEAEAKP